MHTNCLTPCNPYIAEISQLPSSIIDDDIELCEWFYIKAGIETLTQSILKESSCAANTVQPVNIRTTIINILNAYFMLSSLSLIVTLCHGVKIYACNLSVDEYFQHIPIMCVDDMNMQYWFTSG